MPTSAVGMGASRTVGFHPELPSGVPEAVVHATTGNATATSPVSGEVVAVVAVGAAAPPAGVGEVVVADPMSELPHPASTPPTANRHNAAATAEGRTRRRRPKAGTQHRGPKAGMQHRRRAEAGE